MISTYGIISTKTKDIWAVRDAIKKVLGAIKDNSPKPLNLNNCAAARAHWEISSNSKGLLVHFTDNLDKRTLWAHFDCDNDSNNIVNGPKIILSLGAHGNSVDIIRKILIELKGVGKCYLVPFDANDEFEEI